MTKHPGCAETINHEGHELAIGLYVIEVCDGRVTSLLRDEQCDSPGCDKTSTQVWEALVDARYSLTSLTVCRFKLCQDHHELYMNKMNDHWSEHIGRFHL